MSTYQDLYKLVEGPLSWAAEDNGGVITKKQVKMIVMEYCRVIDRQVIAQKIQVLEMFKVLVPVNKTSYRFVPNGKDSKVATDSEKIAVEAQLMRITGRGKA